MATDEEVKYKFSSDWIHTLEDERHWQYYHAQQAFIGRHISRDDEILEVGIGTSFTSNYLKSKAYKVRTLDIDAEKKPDIVGNIVTDKLPDDIDVLLAFEVFEHIPYEEFLESLAKMAKSGVKKVFISIPYNEKVWVDVDVRVHVLGRIRFQLGTRRNKLTTDHHRWEIRYRDYSLRKVKSDIMSCGYQIEDDQRIYAQHFIHLSLK